MKSNNNHTIIVATHDTRTSISSAPCAWSVPLRTHGNWCAHAYPAHLHHPSSESLVKPLLLVYHNELYWITVLLRKGILIVSDKSGKRMMAWYQNGFSIVAVTFISNIYAPAGITLHKVEQEQLKGSLQIIFSFFDINFFSYTLTLHISLMV